MKLRKFKKSLNISMIFVLMLSMFTPMVSINVNAADGDSITVADAINNNSGGATVKGYIVGHVASEDTVNETAGNDYNFAIADNVDKTDTSQMLYIQLPSDFRADFGLQTNPDLLGEQVTVTGSLEAYFGSHAGLKSTSDITIVEADDSISVAEAINNNSGDTTVKGYIVGHVASEDTVNETAGNDYNFAIADNVGETDTRQMLYIQLPSDFRADFGLQTNPDLLGEQVTVTGSLEAYFGSHAGLKSTSDITITNSEPTVPEEPAEVVSIVDARTQETGEVAVKGVVTAKLSSTMHIEDETAAIAIYPGSAFEAELGDEVTVSGSLGAYNGLLQIQSPQLIEKTEQVGMLDPAVLTGAELKEETESRLAVVNNVIVESDAGYGNFNATDGTTSFIVRDENGELGLTAGVTYDSIAGIVQEYNGNFQILPRSVADVIEDSSVVQPVYATPGAGAIASGTNITFTSSTEDAAIYYTLNGDDPTENDTLYEGPITITEDTTVKAIAVNDSLGDSKVSDFNYTMLAEAGSLEIYDIQGSAHVSPYQGQVVREVPGIVTHTENNGFYFQSEVADENVNTSEAVYVYSRDHEAQVGDDIRVDGEVDEYGEQGYDGNDDLTTTQIYSSNVEIVSSGNNLPDTIVVGVDRDIPEVLVKDEGTYDINDGDTFNAEENSLDFYESLEGMLLEIPGKVTVTGPQKYDEITVISEEWGLENRTDAGGIYLEESGLTTEFNTEVMFVNVSSTIVAKTGDFFDESITGVLGYNFGNFKLDPIDGGLPQIQDGGNVRRDETNIVFDEDKLTVATYNVQNFYKGLTDKTVKLAKSMANELNAPDIITLVEAMDKDGDTDSGTTSASETYQALIDEIIVQGGPEYAYVEIAPVDLQDGGIPGGNIRVGHLYRTDRVEMAPGDIGGATDALAIDDNGDLNYSTGRIDPTNPAFESSRKSLLTEFIFNGESVYVIGNHWNSKSGDVAPYGMIQPAVQGSREQRNEIANVIGDFIAELNDKNPGANVVVLGDFNDYPWSGPIETVKSKGDLYNSIEELPRNQQYTYNYNGISQSLDSILVSNHLKAGLDVDVMNINSGFMETHGRASDHDPMVVQLDLSNPVEKTFNLKNLTTDKLVVKSLSVSISLDDQSVIKEGIFLTGDYAEFNGAGLATATVTVNPDSEGAIVDFKGTNVLKVVIDGENVSEVRGAENIQEIEYVNGANADDIDFTDSEGEPLGFLVFPIENNSPVLEKVFDNLTVSEGETISLLLTDYFSDPDNDQLTFTYTLGSIDSDTLTLQLEQGDHIVAVSATDGEESITASFSVTVIESSLDPYYIDAAGKEGEALKSTLHDIISGHEELEYTPGVWDALRETDEDPNNPENVILFYSGESLSKEDNGGNVGDWNREHVWAKSHGDFGTSKGAGTDIHHLRPTDVQVNSTRSNLDFDNGGTNTVTNCSECKRSSNSTEPPNDVKGDVARMLFYMAVRYESEDGVDLELNDQVDNGSNPFHGKLSTLLEWHEQDPVSNFEKNRNDVIFGIQGNRNPFIDNPDWAVSIWGQVEDISIYYDEAA